MIQRNAPRREMQPYADAIALRMGCKPTADYSPGAEPLVDEFRSLKAAADLLGYDIKGMLSSSDLDALIDGSTRRVVADTGRYDTSHRQAAKLLSAPNFKPVSLARVIGGTLQPRNAGESARPFAWSASRETASVADYAAHAPFSRESAINAEWDLLAGLTTELAAGAYRRERAELVTVIEANGALDDGVAQFHVDRANVQAGELSVTTLGAAMGKLRALPGADGTPLELTPSLLMVPGDDEAATLTLLEQAGLSARITVMGDSRLAAAYLLPNPEQTPVFGVIHLDGQRKPIVTTKRQPRTDTWQIACRLDLVAVALTPRAIKLTLS